MTQNHSMPQVVADIEALRCDTCNAQISISRTDSPGAESFTFVHGEHALIFVGKIFSPPELAGTDISFRKIVEGEGEAA